MRATVVAYLAEVECGAGLCRPCSFIAGVAIHFLKRRYTHGGTV